MTTEITCAIVLYNNDSVTLQKAINSLLDTGLNIRVYLIDNSLNDTLEQLAQDSRIEYVHNPSNPGFGAAHNVAIKHAMESGSNYHFIVNPDIYFTGDVITPMVNYMAQHADVGMMMPEVLNDDGTIQYLPKLLPSPFWILRRKLKQPKAMHERFVSKYELRNVPADIQYNAPILSGCFTLLSL